MLRSLSFGLALVGIVGLAAVARAETFSVSLFPGDDAAAVAKAGGAARWLRLGPHLVVDGDARLATAFGRRPVKALAAAAPLQLLYTKHPWEELGADVNGAVLVRHAGVALVAPPAGKRLVEPAEFHVRLGPVAWNRTVVEAVAAPRGKGSPDPLVDPMVAMIDSARMKADIQKLVDFQTRHSLSEGYKNAAAWAVEQFTAAGLTAKRVPFAMSGRQSENVIAEVAGQPGVDDLYLVGGHLDSISGATSMTQAPGADDNASGSACVLAIARVFGKHRPRATIRFALFGGEEQGLLGSEAYLAGLPAAERARLKGVIILDMTAYHATPQQGVMLEGRAVTGKLFDAVANGAARYTDLKVERTLDAWGSDHVPFLDADIPAMLTLELDYPENGKQHSLRDTMAVVDPEQAAKIAKADVAALAALAGLANVNP